MNWLIAGKGENIFPAEIKIGFLDERRRNAQLSRHININHLQWNFRFYCLIPSSVFICQRSSHVSPLIPCNLISSNVFNLDIPAQASGGRSYHALSLPSKEPSQQRVKKWGFSLEEALKDPAGQELFLKFLESEFSSENLRWGCKMLQKSSIFIFASSWKLLHLFFLMCCAPESEKNHVAHCDGPFLHRVCVVNKWKKVAALKESFLCIRKMHFTDT